MTTIVKINLILNVETENFVLQISTQN